MAYYYTLKDSKSLGINQIIKSLSDHFTVIRESREEGNYFYYDTFDWRLYQHDYHLFLFNLETDDAVREEDKRRQAKTKRVILYNYKKDNIVASDDLILTINNQLNLPGGSIPKKINPIIDVRSLINVATIKKASQSFRILNNYDKTIARLKIDHDRIREGNRFKSLDAFIELRPLRGYTKSLTDIKKKIDLDDLKGDHDDLLKRALMVLGRAPVDYSSKINIILTPQLPAVEALKVIYLYLIQVMRRNEDGILKDIDIEHLHDFRVSVRRSRSVLGQIKTILEGEIVENTKKLFSYLGRSTNKLRDIDVYLLEESKYRSLLPHDMHNHIYPFFEHLKNQRKHEHQLIKKTLKSAKYKRSLDDWELYLNTTAGIKDLTEFEKKPIIDIARIVIRKRNAKVLKFGKETLKTLSDELLHQLRIECKKLRYLLEFFNSLFPQNKIQFLIRKLKLLQDNLGRINDMVIQQQTLIEFAGQLSSKGTDAKDTVLAIGILIGKLHEKQKSEKKKFSEIFKIYAGQEVQIIFHDLFWDSKRGLK
jgi:CHAD domain-containing protein